MAVAVDCVASSFFPPSLLGAGVVVACLVAVGTVVEVALASLESMAVGAGVLPRTLLSWLAEVEVCTAESPLHATRKMRHMMAKTVG